MKIIHLPRSFSASAGVPRRSVANRFWRRSFCCSRSTCCYCCCCRRAMQHVRGCWRWAGSSLRVSLALFRILIPSCSASDMRSIIVLTAEMGCPIDVHSSILSGCNSCSFKIVFVSDGYLASLLAINLITILILKYINFKLIFICI